MKKWNVLKRLGSLLLALFLVLGMLPATHAHAADFSGGEKFYLSPGPWAVDGAWFAFYVFGNNGNGWASMTDSNGDGIYEGTAPAGTWTNIIFCRMNPAGSEPSWDYKWNQTADLVCDVNTVPGYDGKNNHYIITGWNANDGAWKHDWKIDDTSTCFCGAECDHFDSDMVEDKPTCVSNGWLRFTCRTCGYKWTSPGGNPEPENDAAHVWQKTGSGTRGVCEASYTCYNDPEHTKTVPFAAHSFTDSVCTNCGYGCDHIAAMADGVCTVCGWECDHHSWTEISGYATCYYCGIDAVAKVVDTYYPDIEEALAKAQETDGCTLTLYQNVSGLTKTLTVSKGNFTILGNSNTLSGTIEGPVLKITGGTVLLSSLEVENPSTAAASRAVEITGGNVTVRGSAINAGHSGIFIPLDSDPTVTLVGCTVTGKSGVDNNSTASTLNLGTATEAGPTIQGTTYGVSSRGKVYFNSGSVSGEYGFYLVPGASVTLYDEYCPINATAAHFFIAGAPTGELNFRYAPSEGKYKIKATLPGTFAKPVFDTVELDPAGFISVTKGLLLAKDGDNLILKQCGHENIESEATCKAGAICADCGAEVSAAEPDAHIFDAATGKCGNGCGLEMAAASATVGSTTTYYLTVQAALDAASQAETATVKLLRSDENVAGLTMTSGNVRLEMNGLTLKGSVSQNGILQLSGAKLSVVGGTVENTAADGCGIYAAYNESTHRYSTIDVDSSTVIGVQAGIMTNKGHVSVAQSTVTGTEYGILARNAGWIDLESGAVRGEVGVHTSAYGGILTLGAEGTGGPTVYGKTHGIDSDCDVTAYSGTINCPEGIGIFLGWHYSGPNESAGAGLYLEGTPTINAATDIYLDYDKTLVDNRYIQVNVALTDGTYSVDCQMDYDVIAKPGTGITLQRTWFTSANAAKFVQHSAHGYLSLGPCAHGDKKAVQNEDGVTHDVFCNICQTTPEKDVPCSGGTATCKNKAICTACGEQYGELGTIHKGMDPATGYCSSGCGTRLAVAMIEKNSTASYSADLAAAFAAVKDCVAADYARINLLKNVTLTGDVTVEGGVFDLDMMGKTIDAGEYELIIEGGKIQMEDGTITGKNKGTLRVEGGELTIWRDMILDNHLTASTAICGTVIVDGGAVTLNGGTVTSSGDSAAVFVNSGSFTLQSGAVEQPSLMYALFLHSGEATLTGGTLSSAKEDAVFVWRGTLNVGGTAMTHGPGKYHVQCDSDQTKLNFTAATGKEYTIEASKNISVGNLTYNSAKHAVTSTDSDLSDGSYAKGSIVTLSCTHKNATATSNGNGTHKVVCNDCGTVAENEACTKGDAVSNGDGTHKVTCSQCQGTVVASETCKEVCTSKGNETHKITCKDCGAVLVASEPHTVNSSGDACADCGTRFAAKLAMGGNTTYYEKLDNAIRAAESSTDKSTRLTLLMNVYGETAIRGGTFTLDLNGHSLVSGRDYNALRIANSNVEITGEGTLSGDHGVDVKQGSLLISGGTYEADTAVIYSNATVTVTGGTFTASTREFTNNLYGSTDVPVLSGGTYTNGLRIGVPSQPVSNLLAPGYRYWQNGSMLKPTDSTTSLSGTITVALCDHSDGQAGAPYTNCGDGTHTATYSCCGKATEPMDHSYTFTADNANGTITRACDCGERLVFTLVLPGQQTYGDPAMAVPSYTCSDTGYSGTLPVITVDGKTAASFPTTAGTYPVVMTWGGASVSGSFAIAKAELAITMTYSGYSNLYGRNLFGIASVTGAEDVDGLSITVQLVDGSGSVVNELTETVEDGSIVWNWLNKRPDDTFQGVGQYTIRAKFAGDDNHESLEATLGDYTITPAPLNVVALDQTVTYGQDIATGAASVTAEVLIGTQQITAVTLTPSTENVTADGQIVPSAATVMEGDVDVTANYDITYVPGKLVIEPDSTPIDDLDVDTVTSDDAEDIQSVKEMMAAADSVKDEWNDITDKVSQLQERLADAAAAAESGAEDIVEEDLMFSHEEELEDAAAALEKALEDFGGNYTDEEKQAIQEELARIEFLLAAIEEAKPVKEMIDELPDPETIEPDDEDVIADFSAMLKAAKELSLAARRPLSNMDKVQKIIDALISYEIIKGEGGKYTLGSSEGLSFTANGPVDAGEVKFLGIQVDGKDVAEDAYTVTSGSTIVALKAEYLNTLAEGEHTIVFNYDFMGLKINTDEASFQVVKKAAAPGGESGNPDTGDASQLPLWTGMAVIGLLGMAVLLCAPRKKGKYQR